MTSSSQEPQREATGADAQQAGTKAQDGKRECPICVMMREGGCETQFNVSIHGSGTSIGGGIVTLLHRLYHLVHAEGCCTMQVQGKLTCLLATIASVRDSLLLALACLAILSVRHCTTCVAKAMPPFDVMHAVSWLAVLHGLWDTSRGGQAGVH